MVLSIKKWHYNFFTDSVSCPGTGEIAEVLTFLPILVIQRAVDKSLIEQQAVSH